jgi:hypothetical protein
LPISDCQLPIDSLSLGNWYPGRSRTGDWPLSALMPTSCHSGSRGCNVPFFPQNPPETVHRAFGTPFVLTAATAFHYLFERFGKVIRCDSTD